jgi:hypothetical protein
MPNGDPCGNEAEFKNVKFCWAVSNHFARGGGGGGGGTGPLVEVTVNSKEENSENFCPKYVPEFGLCCDVLYLSGMWENSMAGYKMTDELHR